MGWLITNRRPFWPGLAPAVAALAVSVSCSTALADETVQVCGSSYANNIFAASSAPGIIANQGCPTTGSTDGLELFGAGETIGGETGRWQTVAPAGLELVGATARGLASQGVNSGLDYGGGFYWAGGGAPVNAFSPA